MIQTARPDRAEKASQVIVAAILMFTLIKIFPPLSALAFFGFLFVVSQKQSAKMAIYRSAEAKRLGAILHLTAMAATLIACNMMAEHKAAERAQEMYRIVEEVRDLRISTATVAPAIILPSGLSYAWQGPAPRNLTGYHVNAVQGLDGGEVMLICVEGERARIFLPGTNRLTRPFMPEETCNALAALPKT